MTPQPGKPNISRIRSNQTMKFGQLIEYDMRNTFLEKSYAKYDGGTISRPFSEKPKLSIFLDQQPKFLNCLFSLSAKLKATEIFLNQAAEQLLFPYIKLI